MEIKLPNGTGVVTENKDCIKMYLKMGGVEVGKKTRGKTQKEPPKENTKEK